MPRIIDAFTQFFDAVGDPLIGGWLKFTESETTDTLKDTFSDAAETIANTNPLQLDASGRCPDVFGTGSYRVVSYYDSDGAPGVQLQVFDPVGVVTTATSLELWDASLSYALSYLVMGSDGKTYRSIIPDNLGNNPTVDEVNWEQVEIIGYWKANKTYSQYDLVRSSTGDIYVSQANSNLNNDPVTDIGDFWLSSGRQRSVVVKTGGGPLTLLQINELQDSNTYTLPLASSVRVNDWVIVEITDKYSTSTPVIQRSGSDTISDIDGSDTAVLCNLGLSTIIRFVSDGISDWRF